jgi:hypothetical protein
MASNRPPGVTWESYTDALFRQARENGEFERLPGAGKPIAGLDEPYDENWWLKQYLHREDLSVSPDTLRFKAELVVELDALWDLPAEDQVRKKLLQLNAQIYRMNALPTEGPALNVGLIDAKEMIARWREKRKKAGA